MFKEKVILSVTLSHTKSLISPVTSNANIEINTFRLIREDVEFLEETLESMISMLYSIKDNPEEYLGSVRVRFEHRRLLRSEYLLSKEYPIGEGEDRDQMILDAIRGMETILTKIRGMEEMRGKP